MDQDDPDFQVQLSRATGDLDRLVRRLRGLSHLAMVRHRTVVDEFLSDVERSAAQVDRRDPRPLPAIADHALADAVDVVAHDALASVARSRDPNACGELLSHIRRALESTR